jgi:hypothetical protein
MGCSSIYCQISRIAINEGDDCVLIPMSRSPKLSYRVYQVKDRWLPLTLPIFGKYDDYQGMEFLEHNANTDLVARALGMDMDMFAKDIFANDWHLKELREYGEVRPCWILRDVWNLMNHIESDSFFDLGLSNVIGNHEVLLRLGFEKIENTDNLVKPRCDPKRFCNAYTLDGMVLWSDGRWIYEEPWDRKAFYEMFPSVNKEVLYSSPIRLMDEPGLSSMLPLLQISEHMHWLEMVKHLPGDRLERFKADIPGTSISDAYWEEIKSGNTFMLNLFYELWCVFINMRHMSCIFEPMLDYITPQCGEHKEHLRFAKEFNRILENKTKDTE